MRVLRCAHAPCCPGPADGLASVLREGTCPRDSRPSSPPKFLLLPLSPGLSRVRLVTLGVTRVGDPVLTWCWWCTASCPVVGVRIPVPWLTALSRCGVVGGGGLARRAAWPRPCSARPLGNTSPSSRVTAKVADTAFCSSGACQGSGSLLPYPSSVCEEAEQPVPGAGRHTCAGQ